MYLGTVYLAIAARTCLLLDLHTVIEVLLSKSASVLACAREHRRARPVSASTTGPAGLTCRVVAVLTARIERTPDVAGQRGPRG